MTSFQFAMTTFYTCSVPILVVLRQTVYAEIEGNHQNCGALGPRPLAVWTWLTR